MKDTLFWVKWLGHTEEVLGLGFDEKGETHVGLSPKQYPPGHPWHDKSPPFECTLDGNYLEVCRGRGHELICATLIDFDEMTKYPKKDADSGNPA
ncbi:MAG: hypothetical protein ACR2NX_04285 [Chthoniobacterales bacterium]